LELKEKKHKRFEYFGDYKSVTQLILIKTKIVINLKLIKT